MATTTFEKPMGSEVETLKGQIGTLSSLTTTEKSSAVSAINEVNSKISNYPIGNIASLSALESALDTLGSSMNNSEKKQITINVTTAFTGFSATAYIGDIYKTISDRYHVTFYRNAANVTIHGMKDSNGWNWGNYALSSRFAWTKIFEKTIAKGTTGATSDTVSSTAGYTEFIAVLDIANSSHTTGFGYNFTQYIPGVIKTAGVQLSYLNNIGGHRAKIYIDSTAIRFTEISATDYDLFVRVYAR